RRAGPLSDRSKSKTPPSPPARVKRPLKHVILRLPPHSRPAVSAHKCASATLTRLRLPPREPRPGLVSNGGRTAVHFGADLRGVAKSVPIRQMPLATNLPPHQPSTRLSLYMAPQWPAMNGLSHRATSPSTAYLTPRTVTSSYGVPGQSNVSYTS